MAEFEDKINELQSHVDVLDQKLSIDTRTNMILFGVAVATPFVVGFLLYIMNLQITQTDEERDRKKILKYSAIVTVIVWILLGGYSYMKNKAV